jgi:hypothetical protein
MDGVREGKWRHAKVKVHGDVLEEVVEVLAEDLNGKGVICLEVCKES